MVARFPNLASRKLDSLQPPRIYHNHEKNDNTNKDNNFINKNQEQHNVQHTIRYAAEGFATSFISWHLEANVGMDIYNDDVLANISIQNLDLQRFQNETPCHVTKSVFLC